MSWMRIHDAALTHPKLTGLVSLTHPFTLWIWGLSYCQTHLTDGFIPKRAVSAECRRAVEVLLDRRLWEHHELGYKVHDYLDWNDSRETVTKKREEAKTRMQASRDRSAHRPRGSPENTPRSSPENIQRTDHIEVLRGLCISSLAFQEGVQGKPLSLDELNGNRAAAFLERYAELFTLHRHGARTLLRPALDFQRACDLCRTWEDARLEKMAVIFLTTDDEWIASTGRGFGVFVSKASWCDDRLKAWELANNVVV